jgi:Mn2+/Fe2+ NRAMP family transporter
LSLAWRRTAGQGFKLVVAMLAIEVAAMVVQQVIATIFIVTGLADAAPMTYLLGMAIVYLLAIAAELAVLVTAFPYFLRETV